MNLIDEMREALESKHRYEEHYTDLGPMPVPVQVHGEIVLHPSTCRDCALIAKAREASQKIEWRKA
jgi:hypothetical protein